MSTALWYVLILLVQIFPSGFSEIDVYVDSELHLSIELSGNSRAGILFTPEREFEAIVETDVQATAAQSVDAGGTAGEAGLEAEGAEVGEAETGRAEGAGEAVPEGAPAPEARIAPQTSPNTPTPQTVPTPLTSPPLQTPPTPDPQPILIERVFLGEYESSESYRQVYTVFPALDLLTEITPPSADILNPQSIRELEAGIRFAPGSISPFIIDYTQVLSEIDSIQPYIRYTLPDFDGSAGAGAGTDGAEGMWTLLQHDDRVSVSNSEAGILILAYF